MVGSRRGLMVGLLMLVTAVAFEAQAVSTAMPAVADDLGRLDLYAWAFTAFMIPQIVAIVLAGRLCDRFGPVRPLHAGVALFASGVVLSASAPVMEVFLLGRFVQGFGGGVVNLSLLVVVGRAFAASQTGRVMTWFSFAWMLPSFLGPSAAALIVGLASWHLVFWAVLPLVLTGIAFLIPALRGVPLPPLHDPDASPASLVAALGAASGVGLIQVAGLPVPVWGQAVAGASGVVLLAASVPRLMPRGWRPLGRGLSSVIGTRALATGAFFAFSAFLPQMLRQLRHADLALGGIVLTVASLGWTFGSTLQSQPWMRLSRDRIVVLGVSAVVGGLVVVSVTTLAPELPLALLITGAVIAGIGMGLSHSSTSILTMQLSAQHELGRNTSSLQIGESMGNALVAGLSGSLFALFNGRSDAVASYGVPSLLVAVCAAGALAMASRIGPVPNLSSRPRTAHADT